MNALQLRPFRACTIKIRNITLIYGRIAESGNIALSFMRHASGHNYRNSSFIVDVAIWQIPRSTERISSFSYITDVRMLYNRFFFITARLHSLLRGSFTSGLKSDVTIVFLDPDFR